MFARGHFPGTYYAPTYFPPGFGLGFRGGPPEEEPEESDETAVSSSSVPDFRVAEAIFRERILQDNEDEILLLLLSDQIGSIGAPKQAHISIREDEDEALLLLLGSDPWK